MNRILKRALWGTLIAGGITLAGATAANAAEAPPNGVDCGCNVVKSALTTVTSLLTGPCDQTPSGGQPGSGGAEGTSGLPAVAEDAANLVTDTVDTVTSAVPGGSTDGGAPGGGSDPGLPSAPVDNVLDTVGGIANTATNDVASTVSGVTENLPALPGTGGGTPGGGLSAPGVVTIPVPGVGTVHAGLTPDGLNVGKNLDVLGVKDDWELAAGTSGVATTDRIGTDSTNVNVDAGLPITGTHAPHASVTLPELGALTGGLPGLPGLPGSGGLPGLPGSGGGSLPGVPSLPVGDLTGVLGGLTGNLPGGSLPSHPGTGGAPGVVTVPVPGVGSVHAGATPDGLNLGKNLNVLGVKDVWDLTAGRNGVATTDRIGTDATNVYVDAALPATGTTAPHASVTLPSLGGLTGGLPGLPTMPGLPGTGGTPGGNLPGLPSLPIGDLTGVLGGLTGSLPGLPGNGGSPGGNGGGTIPGLPALPIGDLTGVLGGLTGSLPGLPSVPGLPSTGGGIAGSLPGVIGGITGSLPAVIGGITGSLPSLPAVPGTGTPGAQGTPGTPGTGTGTPGTGIGGTTPGAGNGGVQVVSHITHGLIGAARSLNATTAKNRSLAQTGFSDPFLLFTGALLLAAGAATKLLGRR